MEAGKEDDEDEDGNDDDDEFEKFSYEMAHQNAISESITGKMYLLLVSFHHLLRRRKK